MKKYRGKYSSSPLVLIIPLIIAIVVIISAAVITRTKTQTRSQALYNPTEECLKQCRTHGGIKDRAACALDCPTVIAGTMKCKDFCNENVKNNPQPNPTQQANTEKKSGDMIPDREQCRIICRTWIADPCEPSGAVCKKASGNDSKTAKSQCKTSCELVKADTKTCNEVMTHASLSAVYKKLVPSIRSDCKDYFE